MSSGVAETGVGGTDYSLRELARLAGPGSAVVTVGGILLAAYVFNATSSFQWSGEFDQFGVLRHYSIAIGSLFALILLWPVGETASNKIQQTGIVALGTGLVITRSANALGTIGIRSGDWAIIGLLVLYPLGLLVFGGGDLYGGLKQREVASLGPVGLYIATLAWTVSQEGDMVLTYFISFVLISAWVVVYLALRK